jgi:hypothetical protein
MDSVARRLAGAALVLGLVVAAAPRGRRLVPDSLALGGSFLYWMKAGAPVSAPAG